MRREIFCCPFSDVSCSGLEIYKSRQRRFSSSNSMLVVVVGGSENFCHNPNSLEMLNHFHSVKWFSMEKAEMDCDRRQGEVWNWVSGRIFSNHCESLRSCELIMTMLWSVKCLRLSILLFILFSPIIFHFIFQLFSSPLLTSPHSFMKSNTTEWNKILKSIPTLQHLFQHLWDFESESRVEEKAIIHRRTEANGGRWRGGKTNFRESKTFHITGDFFNHIN